MEGRARCDSIWAPSGFGSARKHRAEEKDEVGALCLSKRQDQRERSDGRGHSQTKKTDPRWQLHATRSPTIEDYGEEFSDQPANLVHNVRLQSQREAPVHFSAASSPRQVASGAYFTSNNLPSSRPSPSPRLQPLQSVQLTQPKQSSMHPGYIQSVVPSGYHSARSPAVAVAVAVTACVSENVEDESYPTDCGPAQHRPVHLFAVHDLGAASIKERYHRSTNNLIDYLGYTAATMSHFAPEGRTLAVGQ
jgi:hypothetical protein